MAKIKRVSQKKENLFDYFNYILMGLIMFICIYPFYYVLIYSLSDPTKAARGVYFLPSGISIDTYKGIFALNDLSNAFLISGARTFFGTIITVVCSSFFAYLLTKREMYFRKFIYRFVISSMYLNAGLIPWYITMKMFGLKNNFLLYILPGAVVAFFIILVKTYIEQLPPSLEESAKIDGAGLITIFINIIFPLCKPIIATIAVYSAVGNWNSWQDNFFLVTSTKLQTLQLILYNYLTEAASYANMSSQQMQSLTTQQLRITPESIKMSITVITTVPILLVYPFMQKYFVKGIMMGAVKG